MLNWRNVSLILHREVRDQLRDRRTLFTIAVLPLVLYPLLGMSFLQMTQFMREHPTKVRVIGTKSLPLAILFVVFAVANRHIVTLSFDPFNSSDPATQSTLVQNEGPTGKF